MIDDRLLAIEIDGKRLSCAACSGNQFHYDQTSLGGGGGIALAHIGLVVGERRQTGHVYLCSKCGYIMILKDCNYPGITGESE